MYRATLIPPSIEKLSSPDPDSLDLFGAWEEAHEWLEVEAIFDLVVKEGQVISARARLAKIQEMKS